MPIRSVTHAMKRVEATLGALACLCCCLPAYSQSQTAVGQDPRADYAAKVRESYNFRFGPDAISLPGNAAVAGGEFIQPGAFPTAEYCGHCHPDDYSHWRQAL